MVSIDSLHVGETSALLRAAATPAPCKAEGRRWLAIAAGALLALYAVMAWTASMSKGVSFDEGLQLAVGYNIWLNDDYRIEGANGDFIKRWATLPYLISRPRFVGHDDPLWRGGLAYELGRRFLFELGNEPEALLRQSRAMVALLGLATGLLVFVWARELFGVAGGLISLTLFVFCPHMLAFGGVVSTDMSITLTIFGSTWCIWRLLHRVSLPRIAASLAMSSLMFLAKPSALVIFPVTALMVAVRCAGGGPLWLRWRHAQRALHDRRAQLAVFLVLALLHAFAAWAAVWAHYGFRYTASPNPADPTISIYELPYRDSVNPLLASVVSGLKRAHVFPEGYMKGIDGLLGNDDELGGFFGGEWYAGGRAAFFPFAIWVKTHPGVFLLIALGGLAWARTGRQARVTTRAVPNEKRRRRFYALTPHLALIGCYLAVAMTEDLNIGHRHVLPIYPSLYVLAGAAAIGLRRWGTGMKTIVVLLPMSLVVESLAVRPHYLAYFAPHVGGAESGYKHLADSSLDWGMNLPALKQWLDEHDPGQQVPLFLGYFGNDQPEAYGIKCRRLPGFFDPREVEFYPLTPGYYAISASLFQGVWTAAFGPWSKRYEVRYWSAVRSLEMLARAEADPAKREDLIKRAPPKFWANELDRFDNLRFARLCAWLRHQGDPPHQVGHTIFVWKLDQAALDAAISGPPVELVDTPFAPRRFRHLGLAKR